MVLCLPFGWTRLGSNISKQAVANLSYVKSNGFDPVKGDQVRISEGQEAGHLLQVAGHLLQVAALS